MLIWLTISLCVSKSCARKNPLVGDKANGRASAASILNYSPFMPPWLESGQVPFSHSQTTWPLICAQCRSTKQMGIFFAVVLTIGCRISATDDRSVPWSKTIVLFRSAPASASRMRFTAPVWKHSPGTGDEAMAPAP
jgi:hypothetical protein